jgi:transposase
MGLGTSIQIVPIRLGALPIVQKFTDKLGVLSAMEKHVPSDKRETIAVSRTLLLILYNVILERFPLYKIGQWACEKNLVAPELEKSLNDDRVGRALDKLFAADRAAIVTEIVLTAIKVFELCTDRVHNDSTTVTLTGDYGGYRDTRAAKPLRGHNKDHRPDLRQILFSLSVLGDEAVPIYFKVWDGNVTDDTTHVRNWMALRGLLGRADFTYICDCKLCTRENMEFIDSEGGFFITVLPQTRAEDKRFKDWIQDHPAEWQEALRRKPKRKYGRHNIYWTFECPFLSSEGFRIIWVKSSQKEKLDEESRTDRIARTEQDLNDIPDRTRRNRQRLEDTVQEILKAHGTQNYFHWQITASTEEIFKQDHKGRPSSNTRYRKVEKHRYRLVFSHNADTIRYSARCDGIFPLITNRRKDPAKTVLEIYKFQPRLEKRHEQFKTVYQVAPVFIKNPERIEALMLLYFIALMITSLIERQVRLAMGEKQLPSIPIYPEQRECKKPTADKLLDLFRDVRLHRVSNGHGLHTVADALSEIQSLVLGLVRMSPEQFFETAC